MDMRTLKFTLLLAAATALLSGCAVLSGDPAPWCRDFDAAGVERVLLRAEGAAQAEIVTGANPDRIRVCGVPNGGAAGYHPPDPNWRETSADEWGLDFKEKRFGAALVVSSYNEIEYIHHYYYFDKLRIERPEGVAVTLKGRELTGDGEADLSPP